MICQLDLIAPGPSFSNTVALGFRILKTHEESLLENLDFVLRSVQHRYSSRKPRYEFMGINASLDVDLVKGLEWINRSIKLHVSAFTYSS